MLVLTPTAVYSQSAEYLWDNRCEECHGDSSIFAGKYLWDIDGQLQGRHHINNLALFMSNHYIPDHASEIIRNMLLSKANSPIKFKNECRNCHGEAKEFVEKSLWVRGSEITGMATGMALIDFLPTHQNIPQTDITFFRELFARIAGKPLP